MGVVTESDATFQNMAENIRDIPSMQNINGDLVYGKVTGAAIESGDFVYATRKFGEPQNVYNASSNNYMLLRTLKNNRGIILRNITGNNLQAALIKLNQNDGTYTIGNYITICNYYCNLAESNSFVIMQDDGNKTICCGVTHQGVSNPNFQNVFTIVIDGDSITSNIYNTIPDNYGNIHYILKLTEHCVLTAFEASHSSNNTWGIITVDDSGVAKTIAIWYSMAYIPGEVFQIDNTHAGIVSGGAVNGGELITLNAEIPTNASKSSNFDSNVSSIFSCATELHANKSLAFNIEMLNIIYLDTNTSGVTGTNIDFSSLFPSSNDLFSEYSYYNCGFMEIVHKDTNAEIYLSLCVDNNTVVSMVIEYDYDSEEFSPVAGPTVRTGTNIGVIYNIPHYSIGGLAINHNVYYHRHGGSYPNIQVRNDLGYNITVSKPSGTINAIAIESGSANQTINFIVEPSLW